MELSKQAKLTECSIDRGCFHVSALCLPKIIVRQILIADIHISASEAAKSTMILFVKVISGILVWTWNVAQGASAKPFSTSTFPLRIVHYILYSFKNPIPDKAKNHPLLRRTSTQLFSWFYTMDKDALLGETAHYCMCVSRSLTFFIRMQFL